MLKKIAVLMFALVFCCMAGLPAIAQQGKAMQKRTDTPHEFAVQPGTEEWLQLGSLEARREACFVSVEEAERMTTRALAITVLNYPFIVDMYAFNTLEAGLKSVGIIFPAINVMLSREDAIEELRICAEIYCGDEDVLKRTCAESLVQYLKLANRKHVYLSTRSSTYVLTPNGSQVDAEYDCSWSDHGITQAMAASLAQSYLNIYPSTTLVAPVSPKYNCHSYAFYSQQTTNKYWISNPVMYDADNSYTIASRAVGRVVVYSSYDPYIHSGRIVTVGTGDSTMVVRSKWGCSALFTHKANDCPYYMTLDYFLIKCYKRNY